LTQAGFLINLSRKLPTAIMTSGVAPAAPVCARERKMSLTGHYQNAYVTPDLDAAVALMVARLDAPVPVLRRDATQHFVTPDGQGEGSLRLAFIHVGRLQYELIQPLSGNVALFADAVIADQPLRLHHVAMRANDIDAVRAEHERNGQRVVLEGQYLDRRFLYIDARAILGHYLEYVSAHDDFWAGLNLQ
jgi:catechol 2,3-dioxygenase-like lactoylglutathione lyase family enzyme